MRPLAALALLVLAACGSAPVTHWHSLMAAEAPARAAQAPAPGELVVQIDAPLLPRQLDQAQWLVRRADEGVVALEHERWTTALGDELRAALAARLVQRWGATDARVAAAPPPWRVSLQVLSLDGWPGRGVHWDTVWSISGPGGSLTCRSVQREAAASNGFAALAGAHRAALQAVGDAIGAQLLALQRGEGAACANG